MSQFSFGKFEVRLPGCDVEAFSKRFAEKQASNGRVPSDPSIKVEDAILGDGVCLGEEPFRRLATTSRIHMSHNARRNIVRDNGLVELVLASDGGSVKEVCLQRIRKRRDDRGCGCVGGLAPEHRDGHPFGSRLSRLRFAFASRLSRLRFARGRGGARGRLRSGSCRLRSGSCVARGLVIISKSNSKSNQIKSNQNQSQSKSKSNQINQAKSNQIKIKSQQNQNQKQKSKPKLN